VSFDIRRGEVFGLVGESGCGKSTLGLTILRAYDPTAGEITFRPEPGREYDLARLPHRELKPLRREMQIIFQDPFSALSPRMTVRDIIGEAMTIHHLASGQELEARVASLMEAVGLSPQYMKRYPHAFSGGQRQRISIARALVMNPKLIVADEAVSSLDVSVQAQILELLLDLKERLGLTYLFISHNLSVIKYVCTTVGVMYVGKLVEQAATELIFRRPLHPYTEALTAAIPIPDPARASEIVPLKGEVADPASPPPGCRFHPRCAYAKDVCSREVPELRALPGEDPAHRVACHLAGELELKAVLGA
jgi:peptide/nickel transport system ATP-binding protein